MSTQQAGYARTSMYDKIHVTNQLRLRTPSIPREYVHNNTGRERARGSETQERSYDGGESRVERVPRSANGKRRPEYIIIIIIAPYISIHCFHSLHQSSENGRTRTYDVVCILVYEKVDMLIRTYWYWFVKHPENYNYGREYKEHFIIKSEY